MADTESVNQMSEKQERDLADRVAAIFAIAGRNVDGEVMAYVQTILENRNSQTDETLKQFLAGMTS